MKRLYVGCRVRILWSDGWPELAGQEGRIVARDDGITVWGKKTEWLVAPDAWGGYMAPYDGRGGGTVFAPQSRQLEPIQDPGHQVIEWADMADLWTPSGVEA